MDSEDSRDGGDVRSSSSSSSSSSRSRHSSSSESETSKKGPKSPPISPRSPRSRGPSPRSRGASPRSRDPSPRSRDQSPRSRDPSPRSRDPSPMSRDPSPRSRDASPRSRGPRSPSSESRSQSPSAPISKPPRTPDHLSEAHSDINSPETSMPASLNDPKSPSGPKSPSDEGTIASPPPFVREGPKTPQSPACKSPPGSPDRSRPASPDSGILLRKAGEGSRSVSQCPGRNSSLSPARSPVGIKDRQWSPKDKWRRHTKAEQKMVEIPRERERSRSESSQSSRDSSYNKRGAKDIAAQDISEGEMESDQEDLSRKPKVRTKASTKQGAKDLNLSHEDLSDVSDLDSVGKDDTEKWEKPKSPPASPGKPAKVNGISQDPSPKSDSGKADSQKLGKLPQEKTSNTEDGEEQLDFEAEEGECVEPKTREQSNGDGDDKPEQGQLPDEGKPGRRSRGSSLEEGEVSDEAERRPEETEPRPVCRFFSRGACTWGINCRFLHPGVTDKGNYNMFDVVRGVPSAGTYAAAPVRDVAPPESAWERGLRTAKEMVRIANKRKEQDMDFEEKKLHLPLGGVVHDPDAELAYAAAAVGASPPHPHDAPAHHRDPDVYGRPGYGPMYRSGRYPVPRAGDRERYYEHERPAYERERPAYERAPYYDERVPVPDEMAYQKRRVRSSREVIVQRAEVERREVRDVRDVRDVREVRDMREMRREVGRERDVRGDEWADPWMRAEPAARKRKPQSSDDSYSSSSSSNSSSRSSRSPSARRKRRASSSSRQRLSPSVIVRERRLATARATAMNPPAPRRRAASPSDARQLAVNPPPPASHRHKEEPDPYGRNKIPRNNRDRKKYSRSSSSGSESSSSSSESESDSHSSSTSGSSGARRARHARLLNAAARPRMNAAKPATIAPPVAVMNKKDSSSDKESGGRKRAASPPDDDGPASKKAISRREELLKQLKAVEDAIARKRSKI